MKKKDDPQPKVRSDVAQAAHMRNSAGAMGGGKKRRNKKERAKTKKELRDVEV